MGWQWNDWGKKGIGPRFRGNGDFFKMPFLPFKHRGRSSRPAGMHCPLWLGCNSQCDACWRPGFAPRLLLGARQLQATQNPLTWSSVGNSSIRWVHLQHYERVLLPADVHSSSVPLHPAPAYYRGIKSWRYFHFIWGRNLDILPTAGPCQCEMARGCTVAKSMLCSNLRKRINILGGGH